MFLRQVTNPRYQKTKPLPKLLFLCCHRKVIQSRIFLSVVKKADFGSDINSDASAFSWLALLLQLYWKWLQAHVLMALLMHRPMLAVLMLSRTCSAPIYLVSYSEVFLTGFLKKPCLMFVFSSLMFRQFIGYCFGVDLLDFLEMLESSVLLYYAAILAFPCKP